MPIDVPPAAVLAFAAGVFAGSLAPTYYATERLRGFGRFVMARLPYQPPPGKEVGEAMEDAVADDGDDS